MDSSSIVCMADRLVAAQAAATPRLGTVSYYSDSEPDWNEQPYFSRVEEQRGCAGFHIDLGGQGLFTFQFGDEYFAATPGSHSAPEPSRQIAACMRSGGFRVVLSGIGGDEVMGGVPTPVPELSDLLSRAEFSTLARRLKLWALDKRKPWLHLLGETCRGFLPRSIAGTAVHRRPAPWLHSTFVKCQASALSGYRRRLRLFGPLPTFQENLGTLDALRRRLAWSHLSPKIRHEKRYPYLDRSFLEFIYAIPREQLVRPGQRRSLMRRALNGMVPAELLARRRKAFVARAPRIAISAEWRFLVRQNQEMHCASLRFLDRNVLLDAMNKARLGQDVHMIPLLRTLALVCWLRHIADHRVFGDLACADRPPQPETLLS